MQEGDFALPISLSYHTGGIKADEMASSVGLGWSLNAGASISRSVRYKPDEIGYYLQNGFDYSGLLYLILGGEPHVTNLFPSTGEDAEPDLFYFNVNGYSGRFVFDKSRKAHVIPNQDIFVTVLNTLPNPFKFKITTPDGVQYFFDNPDLTSFVGPFSFQDEVESAWRVSKIVSNSLDTIFFNYQFYDFTYHKIEGDQKGVNRNGCPINLLTVTNNVLKSYRILDIQSKNTKIEFEYQGGYRQDLNFGDAKALKKIKLIDKLNNKLIKQVELKTSYFTSTQTSYPSYYNFNVNNNTYLTKRLRLDEVEVCDGSNNCLPPYKFFYNKHNPATRLPSQISSGRDHWGFYNGQDLNATQFAQAAIVPNIHYSPNCLSALANREINTNFNKAFILDEVEYPTGGKSVYEFETAKLNATDYIGGLRLKNVSSYSGASATPMVKNYEYGLAYLVDGAPVYAQELRVDEPGPAINPPVEWADCVENIAPYYFASTDPVNSTGELSSNNIIHEQVTEITNGNGSIESYYRMDDLASNYIDVGSHPYIISYPVLLAGKLYKEIIKNESGTKIKETNFVHDVYTKNAVSASDAAKVNFTCCFQQMFYYPVMTGAAYLKDKEEIVYSPDGLQELITNTHYDYEGIPSLLDIYNNVPVRHHYVTKETTTLSNQTEVIKRFKYAIDFQSQIGSYNTNDTWDEASKAIKSLIDKGKGGTLIEEIITRKEGGTERILKSNLNLFKEFTIVGSNTKPVTPHKLLNYSNTDPILLTSFDQALIQKSGTHYQLQRDLRYTTETEYVSYDVNYNLLEMTSKKDPTASFLWGYNNSYPVAKVVNAKSSDVFYNSFEYGDQTNVVNYGKTGKRSKINGYQKSLNGLTNGDYQLTYWQKQSNNWVYSQASVSVTTNSYSINISGQVDEIRFYPTGALMYTYCYDPLIGITYSNDPNNKILFYEYDTFDRLSIIRDENKYLIKKYCYNYFGQTEDCQTPCDPGSSPIWQNTGNLRCQTNTSCGYTGYQEVEQENVNTCIDPVTNQWVLGPYNPTACASSGLVQLAVINNTGASNLVITFTQTAPFSGSPQSYSIPASSGPIACLLSGKSNKYNVSITANGAQLLASFTLGGITITGTPANFSNMSFINFNGAPVNLTIDPDF